MVTKYLNYKINGEVKRMTAYISVPYGCENSEGKKFSGFMCLRNPLGILKDNADFSPSDISTLMEAFDSWYPDFEYVKKEVCNNDSDFRKLEKSLLDRYDHNTTYIDNFKQMKAAQRKNNVIKSKLEMLKHYGYIPEAMTQESIELHFMQAYEILRGLKAINNKYTVAHTIKWIKKLGYVEHVDRESKVAYYELTKPVLGCSSIAHLVYVIEKNADRGYSISFRSAYVDVSQMENGFSHIWSSKDNFNASYLFDNKNFDVPSGVLNDLK